MGLIWLGEERVQGGPARTRGPPCCPTKALLANTLYGKVDILSG
jgi:hypothetical protein